MGSQTFAADKFTRHEILTGEAYPKAITVHPSKKNTHMEKSYKLNLLLHLFLFNYHGMGENTTEMETLPAFKHQFITSDPTNALGGWNSSSPLCNWPSINCTGG
ncbi:hypothetical protein ACLOJK_000630 [Asimina triloba]